MQGKDNAKKGNNRFLTSILLSGIIHVVILFSAGIISLPSFYNDPDARYLEMKVVSTGIEAEAPQAENNPSDKIEEKIEEKSESTDKQNTDLEEAEENLGQIDKLEFSSAAEDTSSLSRVYKEASFNVSMKYPAGWTYLDQHLDSKLEGVIFWPSANDIKPPPYIHLETMDKGYFYPAKFKKKFIYRNKEYYYNEPVEIGGEWQQSVYVRTGASSDFIIKVIIKGEDNFNKFLPSFYAIVKSFDFNKTIL